jgi:hypothetical protein
MYSVTPAKAGVQFTAKMGETWRPLDYRLRGNDAVNDLRNTLLWHKRESDGEISNCDVTRY